MLLALLACSPMVTTSDPDAPVVAEAPTDTGVPAEDGGDTDRGDDSGEGAGDDSGEGAGHDSGGGDTDAAAGVELVTGASCTTPCTFSARVSGPVARLAYDADGYALGGATPEAPEITYDFSQLGDRVIRVTAYDADGVALADDSRTVRVESDLPEVPYFYQYANDYYPSSTCQNTSIAMVLASFGWGGEPDDITAVYGKDTAQTVSGLASVFNSVASSAGIAARLTGHSDGTLADVHALLDRGLPVIVHGYFTSYGHVMVVLGRDSGGYWVNDPAGTWDERFQGGYPGGWEPTAGDGIYYPKAAFEAAIATWDGSASAPIWYHELR